MAVKPPSLRMVDESQLAYQHPLYQHLEHVPGLSLGLTTIDQLLTWGLTNSLWVFPMATSCCGIELMAAAASRVDLDRMGTIMRASPRQADVMVVAGTITVKMAPRVKTLWDQMPEPKWCIAMGSCAISGDFYRDLYPVVPGIDTFMPVDVYVPGCPPNPESLMHGLMRLQEKVRLARAGHATPPELRPQASAITRPSITPIGAPDRDPALSGQQTAEAMRTGDSPVEAPCAAAPAEEGAAGDAEMAPPPPLPLDADLEAILRAHGVDEIPAGAPPIVPLDRHVALAVALAERGFRQLIYIVASHWLAGRGRGGAAPAETEHYEIAYALRATGRGSRVASWSVRVEAGASAPTLTGVLAGADWQEREQWDLVGVPFAGHPDLRRLMMPEDWEGHPLRKDYAADTHRAPWR
jgi:NADH-quinone oxidoreductase subunit B/C/D